MGYTNGNGEVKMSAMQMTIFGIVFLIIAILAQEFLTKIFGANSELERLLQRK